MRLTSERRLFGLAQMRGGHPGAVRPNQCRQSVCILARTFRSPSGSFERPRRVP